MWFAEPRPDRFGRRRERPFWRVVLFCAAAAGVLAATRPWTAVRFVQLWGEEIGPPAWQSSAGFTLLCTSALVAVMALAETQTRTTRQAVRPASVLLAAVMALALVLHVLNGPGQLRGLTASWTWAFYIGGVAAAALLTACAVRFAAHSNGRGQARGRVARPAPEPRDAS